MATPRTSRSCCCQDPPTRGAPTSRSSTGSRPRCARSPCRCAATATPTSPQPVTESRTTPTTSFLSSTHSGSTGRCSQAIRARVSSHGGSRSITPNGSQAWCSKPHRRRFAAMPDSSTSCSQSCRAWRIQSAQTSSGPSSLVRHPTRSRQNCSTELINEVLKVPARVWKQTFAAAARLRRHRQPVAH